MHLYLKRARKILQSQGLSSLLRTIFLKLSTTFLHTFFNIPKRKIGVYNGIPIPNLHITATQDVFNNIEPHECNVIETYIKKGDTVIIIGTNVGMSTIKAAKKTKKSGKVFSYEAVKFKLDIAKDAAQINNVEKQIEFIHAIIEKNVYIPEDIDESVNVLPASKLPDCRVMTIDCEGAELEVLKNITIKPEIIYTEIHPHLGVNIEEIKTTLQNKNYDIVSCTQEESLFHIVAKLKNKTNKKNN